MTNESIGLIVLFGTGAVTALSGIPLVLGKVPRNRWYGFRLRITLSDDRVWYPVNRSMGWFMIGVGLVPCAFALAAASGIVDRSLAPLLVLMGLSAPTGIALGARKASKIQRALDSASALKPSPHPRDRSF